jgi:hypothetical protein
MKENIEFEKEINSFNNAGLTDNNISDDDFENFNINEYLQAGESTPNDNDIIDDDISTSEINEKEDTLNINTSQNNTDISTSNNILNESFSDNKLNESFTSNNLNISVLSDNSIINDDISDLNTGRKPDQIISVAGKPEVNLFAKLTDKYSSASSLDSKFEAYYALKLHSEAIKNLGKKLSPAEENTLKSIETSFKKDFSAAKPNAKNSVLYSISEKKVEACTGYMKERKIYSDLIKFYDNPRQVKINYLAGKGVNALKIGILDNIESDLVRAKLTEDTKINMNMSMRQFARELGFNELNERNKRAQNKFFNSKKAGYEDHIDNKPTADLRVYTYYSRKLINEDFAKKIDSGEIEVPKNKIAEYKADPTKYNPNIYTETKIDSKRVREAINDEICSQKQRAIIEYNFKTACNSDIESIAEYEKYKDTLKQAETTNMKAGIENWISLENRGGRLAKNIQGATARGLINDAKNSFTKGKGYEKYILLHTGNKVYHNDVKEAPANFCKALAADLLSRKGEPFKIDTIHNIAKSISKMPELKRIAKDPVYLMAAMSDGKTVRKSCESIIKKTYGVEPDKTAEYINKMAKLYSIMNPEGSQSTEYKALRTAIKNIADLQDSIKTMDGIKRASEKLVSLNASLFEKAEKYMKGKKSIRRSTEGILRFDNTLDALGLMAKYAPSTKDQIMVSVNRINEVRKVKAGQLGYVNINAYNEERAKKAYDLVKNNGEPNKSKVGPIIS